jgi:hypothetical protein
MHAIYTYRSSSGRVYYACARDSDHAKELISAYNKRLQVTYVQINHQYQGGPTGTCLGFPKKSHAQLDLLCELGVSVVWRPRDGIPGNFK